MTMVVQVPDSTMAVSVTAIYEKNGEIKMATQNTKADKDKMIVFTDNGGKA